MHGVSLALCPLAREPAVQLPAPPVHRLQHVALQFIPHLQSLTHQSGQANVDRVSPAPCPPDMTARRARTSFPPTSASNISPLSATARLSSTHQSGQADVYRVSPSRAPAALPRTQPRRRRVALQARRHLPPAPHPQSPAPMTRPTSPAMRLPELLLCLDSVCRLLLLVQQLHHKLHHHPPVGPG